MQFPRYFDTILRVYYEVRVLQEWGAWSYPLTYRLW